jgi:Protein of unknown function (DUF1501)
VLREASDYHQESLLRSIENAHRLLESPAAKAFDLALEPKATYDVYDTGRFGLGCLLARRLTEVGVRFIEVTTEYAAGIAPDLAYTFEQRPVYVTKNGKAKPVMDLFA